MTLRTILRLTAQAGDNPIVRPNYREGHTRQDHDKQVNQVNNVDLGYDESVSSTQPPSVKRGGAGWKRKPMVNRRSLASIKKVKVASEASTGVLLDIAISKGAQACGGHESALNGSDSAVSDSERIVLARGTGGPVLQPENEVTGETALTEELKVATTENINEDAKLNQAVADNKPKPLISPKPSKLKSTTSVSKLQTEKSPIRTQAPGNPTQLVTPPSSVERPRQRTCTPRRIPGAAHADSARKAHERITENVPELDLANVDPRLLALSGKLEHREPLGQKPKPQGSPLVWADSRQALCETLSYFRKPQGGCYSKDGHLYGFLFDSVGHCRDYMDPDVIICRAGGGMESDSDGKMVQKKNQTLDEWQPAAFLNDVNHRNPIIVICGNRNGKAVCNMPHQYCVLGWFKPVAVWSEKTAGKGKKIWNTVKYRLERLNNDRTTTWSSTSNWTVSEEDRVLAGSLLKAKCDSCQSEFPQVYLIGWMCLNANCDVFWRLDGKHAPSGVIPYNPAFLLDRAPRWADDDHLEIEPASVRPALPQFDEVIGDHLSYINTRGICCPVCGRCNPRRSFSGWICETPGCTFVLKPSHRPIIPAVLHNPWSSAPSLVRNRLDQTLGVHVEVWHEYRHKICKYTFDGVDGCFIHAAVESGVNQEPGGPDEMLMGLQTQDIGLERRIFAVKKPTSGQNVDQSPERSLPSPPEVDFQENPIYCALNKKTLAQSGTTVEEDQEPLSVSKHELEDGDLMTAFSMNYGMPYKFVASGASRSFETAPEAVNLARARLNWAARTFLKDSKDDKEFNEELIFAYLQGQKIEYHDDGEFGLGPRIATLSLGGPAQMHLRVKQKHYIGCSKVGLFTEEKPIPCSIGGADMFRRRRQAWEALQSVKPDRVAYTRQRKELPRELGMLETRSKRPPNLLTITLSHGDIVLMDGYDIQKYMEHKVVSEGYLRFALTCRTVLEGHLKPEELPSYSVRPETEVERYHGPLPALRLSG